MSNSLAIQPAAAARPAAAVSAAKTEPARHKEGDTARTASAPSKATVTISAAAQAAQEAAETPAQTAREAQGNDRQAQRILAKQSAALKAYSSH